MDIIVFYHVIRKESVQSGFSIARELLWLLPKVSYRLSSDLFIQTRLMAVEGIEGESVSPLYNSIFQFSGNILNGIIMFVHVFTLKWNQYLTGNRISSRKGGTEISFEEKGHINLNLLNKWKMGLRITVLIRVKRAEYQNSQTYYKNHNILELERTILGRQFSVSCRNPKLQ